MEPKTLYATNKYTMQIKFRKNSYLPQSLVDIIKTPSPYILQINTTSFKLRTQ